ncbi:MAG: GNAT family N-acetyltransferase [Candidatus Heimdallarchaeota archaeon]|nr:GNAT family N-acetyltransferase [Candidatus Heimdallarchaeota archaeon]
MNEKEKINFYQELATNAWPPKKIIPLNGWLLRIDDGLFQRANSVVPLKYTGHNLENDIQEVEKIYTDYNLQTIFQLSDYYQPQSLWDKLLELNYKIHAESMVMYGKIKEMINLPINNTFSYSCSTELSAEWFNSLQLFNNSNIERIEIAKRIIARIKQRKIFFFAKQNKSIVGICLAVIERGSLGIYNMAVEPGQRRKGIGLSLIGQMASWALEEQLENIYLQVQGDNLEAIALYEKAKMKEIYKYRYFIK